MPEDWYDIAYINNDEAILHGRRANQSLVRGVLTDPQKRAIEDLNHHHQCEMQALLRGYAGEPESGTAS